MTNFQLISTTVPTDRYFFFGGTDSLILPKNIGLESEFCKALDVLSRRLGDICQAQHPSLDRDSSRRKTLYGATANMRFEHKISEFDEELCETILRKGCDYSNLVKKIDRISPWDWM